MCVTKSNDKVGKIKFPLSIIFTDRLAFLITPITTCLTSNQLDKLFHSPPTTWLSHLSWGKCFFTCSWFKKLFKAAKKAWGWTTVADAISEFTAAQILITGRHFITNSRWPINQTLKLSYNECNCLQTVRNWWNITIVSSLNFDIVIIEKHVSCHFSKLSEIGCISCWCFWTNKEINTTCIYDMLRSPIRRRIEVCDMRWL